jgi:hypothetical protein
VGMSSGLGLQPHETLIQKYLSLRLKDSYQGEGALQERRSHLRAGMRPMPGPGDARDSHRVDGADGLDWPIAMGLLDGHRCDNGVDPSAPSSTKGRVGVTRCSS